MVSTVEAADEGRHRRARRAIRRPRKRHPGERLCLAEARLLSEARGGREDDDGGVRRVERAAKRRETLRSAIYVREMTPAGPKSTLSWTVENDETTLTIPNSGEDVVDVAVREVLHNARAHVPRDARHASRLRRRHLRRPRTSSLDDSHPSRDPPRDPRLVPTRDPAPARPETAAARFRCPPPSPTRARASPSGGGVAGLTAASRLAQAGCDVTVYETGRGPGGRASTRRGDTPTISSGTTARSFFRADDSNFRALVEEWRAAGFVAEWTGTFAHRSTPPPARFSPRRPTRHRARDGSAPRACASPDASPRPPVRSLPVASRRASRADPGVTPRRFVDRRPPFLRPADDAPARRRRPATRASPSSSPPINKPRRIEARGCTANHPDSGLRPERLEGHARRRSDAQFRTHVDSGRPRRRSLFLFQGATVTGDARRGSPRTRPNRAARAPRTARVLGGASTPEYAAERVAAKLTVPGTSPHRRLLEEVAEEMTESIVAMAERASGRCPGRTSPRLVGRDGPSVGWFPDGGATELAAASGGGCLWDAERRVVGCGDFCVKPKVEGAAPRRRGGGEDALGAGTRPRRGAVTRRRRLRIRGRATDDERPRPGLDDTRGTDDTRERIARAPSFILSRARVREQIPRLVGFGSPIDLTDETPRSRDWRAAVPRPTVFVGRASRA